MAQNVWTGGAAFDASWTNPLNWQGLDVPGAADEVMVPVIGNDNYPDIRGAVTCKKLKVANGATVKLNAGGSSKLTVESLELEGTLPLVLTKTLEVTGSITNLTGSPLSFGGEVIFSGNTEHQINGVFTFMDVRVTDGRVLFNNAVQIFGDLVVDDNQASVVFTNAFPLGNLVSFSNKGIVEFNGGWQLVDQDFDFDSGDNGIVRVSGGIAEVPTDRLYTFSNLETSGNGKVEIKGNAEIFGEVDNQSLGGQIILKDGGALIQDKDADNSNFILDVERVGQDHRHEYNFWSMPVAGVTGEEAFPNSNPDDFYYFDAQTQSYARMPSLASEMELGRGYAITPTRTLNGEAPELFTFNGTPQADELTKVPVNKSGLGTNLLGNPFPSPIVISSFLKDNKKRLTNNVYVWQADRNLPDGGRYLDKVDLGTDVIGVAQGFFVVASKNGDVKFKQSHKVFDVNPFFRQEVVEPEIHLSMTNGNGYNDNIMVYFADSSSDGYDEFYDAPKLKYSSELEFYSQVDADSAIVDCIFQGLGKFNADKRVKLGMEIGSSTQLSIQLDDIVALDPTVKIWLWDKQEDVISDLRTGAYSFTVPEAGVYNNRFELLLFPSTLGIEEQEENSNELLAYFNADGLIIQWPNFDLGIEQFQLIDVSGRLVQSSMPTFQAGNLEIATPGLMPGVYIIQLVDAEGNQHRGKVVKK